MADEKKKKNTETARFKAAEANADLDIEVGDSVEITTPNFSWKGTVYTAKEAAAVEKLCSELIKAGAKNLKKLFPEVKKNGNGKGTEKE